ncbi:MAG: S8 family serine peptidase [Deltaproteobacteria bacterium]
MRKSALFLFITALVVTGFVSPSSSAERDFAEGQLIIKLKPRTGESDLRAMLLQNRLSLLGAVARYNLILVQIPNGLLLDALEERLGRSPNVEFVERNYLREALLTPNDPNFGAQYHHARIQATQAWNIETGNPSVVIAVLDTGVQSNHPDLSGKGLTGRNFVGSSSNTNTSDANGHGTGVAGSAAAKTNNSIGVAGVCWGCSVLPVKVLSDGGSGTLFDIIEGISYVADYARANPSKRVIINLSLGGSCSSSSSEQNALNDAWASGALIIAAAGNSGDNSVHCPAARANVLAVSATDSGDGLASFSTFGNFVDIAAPGVSIRTTWRNSSYITVSGTSFSAPITAGLAGLIWSHSPSLSNAALAKLIRDTADDIGSQGFDSLFGAGRVNALTAIEAAGGGSDDAIDSVPDPTPTPTPEPVVDLTPPAVTITQPAGGSSFTGGRAKTISAAASDNISVARVEFSVNGKLLATDASAPYATTWNPSIGLHTIRAVATDSSGNTASHQITVRRIF